MSRVKLVYPKISDTRNCPLERCIAFEKYDGTNLHEFKIARAVYRGKLTGKFIDDVREGKYGVTEGVVCKGGRNGNDVWMVKIKTYSYMKKLQQAFKDNWENYWE
jgi:hypothetical protein